ncbi:MAG: trypsin-like peptidase domain-containing protein, partial [Candidatus Promineifilaceae bacterium]|nr:trypsin-like peptidase domain-containing protein [Candidatus Promineifilaceae bacterium]
IVAEGSFVDPAVGLQLNTAGSGSGFIIDPSGLAVTNNHVVTGAALLNVYVGGEDRPRNARVLGVSECSDLALIDIDGEDFTYLEWFEGEANVGLDVFAAGFPLGDPEFTLTRGIVSKARADGETSWASVDNALEHDATINPGNSGGPLVTDAGQVVGVNYAGSSQTDQYFAISRLEAEEVLAQLRLGEDVTSIGVNGTAVLDPESGLSGVWVASVESGSPADNAGITGGDIITRLEGLVLATDGTLSSYCDILRSRQPSDVLRVEVLRFDTQEVLEGQLNGEPLTVSVDFSETLGQEASGDDGVTYDNYITVSDDSGRLEVSVPVAWGDVDGTPWTNDEGDLLGPAISAAPDLQAYRESWTTPGIEFAALTEISEPLSVEELLEFFDFSDSCAYGGRESYSDPLYSGLYDIWENCGDVGTLYVVLSAVPDDGTFSIVVTVQVVSDADLDALDQILDTFIVYP